MGSLFSLYHSKLPASVLLRLGLLKPQLTGPLLQSSGEHMLYTHIHQRTLVTTPRWNQVQNVFCMQQTYKVSNTHIHTHLFLFSRRTRFTSTAWWCCGALREKNQTVNEYSY